MAEIKYVSLQNLTSYDTLIKQYIKDADDVVDAKSIKTVLWDATSEKIKFFKKQNATLSDTADYEVAISSSDVANLKTRVGMDSTLNTYQTKTNVTDIVNVLTADNTTEGSVAKSVKDAIDDLDATKSQTAGDDGLALSITQTDGKITAISGSIAAETYDAYGAAQDVADSLADVATSGKAADVSVEDAANKITATNVEGALLEIVNKADANATAITTLNGADTVDGSVAKSIKTAIEALDKEDTAVANQFVTAVSETDGVITVSRAALTADDIPTLTLSKISDAGTAAASNVATAAIAEESTDASLVTAAQVAKFVKDEVADLEGATHFRGIFDKLDNVTNPANGDIAIIGVKEYIYVKASAEAPGEWKELGDESIYVAKTTTIAGVDLENDITKDELLTAINVADGAQVNVLEGVQVNGADLAITDKKVNVTVATGATNGTVAVNGTDVAVKGLGSAAYTESTAYEAAGSIKTEIEKLDATVSTVTEADPTPVVAVSVTEEDGKLTSVTASIKDGVFASKAQGDKADTAVQPSDLVVATQSEIEGLFAATPSV